MGAKIKEKLDKLARIEEAQRKSSEDWRKRKKEGGQKQISIWLENSKIEVLDKLCASSGKNRSEIVSEFISQHDDEVFKVKLDNSRIEALERICAHLGKDQSQIISEMIDTYDATFLKKLTGDEKEKYMAGKSAE